MTSHHGTETEFELTTIERLQALDYKHLFGMEIVRPQDEVVLKDLLKAALIRRYPAVPTKAIDEAVAKISRPQGGRYHPAKHGFSPDARAGFRASH